MLKKEDIEQFYKDVSTLGLKFPVAAISEATGQSKSNVSKYLSRNLEPSEAFLKKFYDKFPVSSKKVSRETIVQESKASYLQTRQRLKNSSDSEIPVFAGNTRAGTIQVYSDDPSVNEPVGHLPASIFPGCNHAEKVSGDSMHPLVINQGFVIGKIVDKKGIIYGEKYIVHTKYGMAMVKYLQEGTKKGLVKLVSYNKHISPQEISYDDITFCCRIYFIVNPS